MYGTITIPQAVFDEIKSTSVRKQVKANRDWIFIEQINDASQKQMYRAKLHAGEVEVMILAQKKKADLVILDDNAAKKTAKFLGLRVIGTLGIFVLAKKRGYIKEVSPVLDALKRDGFFVSNDLCDLVLKQADEK